MTKSINLLLPDRGVDNIENFAQIYIIGKPY